VTVFVVLFVVAAVSKHDSTMYDRIIGLIRVSRGAVGPEPDEGSRGSGPCWPFTIRSWSLWSAWRNDRVGDQV
jgi:hypothetical protein